MTLKDITSRVKNSLNTLDADETGTSMIEWAIYAAIVATAGIAILSKFFGDSGLGKVANQVIDAIMNLFSNDTNSGGGTE